MRCAVFLDRDGVLNRNIWNPETKAYESPLAPEQFELLPDVTSSLGLLRDSGYLLFLVSNQPNFAKGKASLETLAAIHNRFEAAIDGIRFQAFYYCFHHPDFTGECCCRKPSPYFLLQARDSFHLDLAQSWMVGDRPSDVACGLAAGVRTIEIGKHMRSEAGAEYITDSLWAAAQIIVSSACR